MNYETKILPSGIVIENRPDNKKYCWYIWYIKSTWVLHNEGEPAAEYSNGDKAWYLHGRQHRLDGPAYEYGFSKTYYINGVYYDEKEYWKHPEVLKFKYLQEHPDLEAFV